MAKHHWLQRGSTTARRVGNRNGDVKTGIDVLEAHNFECFRDRSDEEKIGLLTNQTGLDLQGRAQSTVLANAPGVSLEAIFSPEHGLPERSTPPISPTQRTPLPACRSIASMELPKQCDGRRLMYSKKLDAVVIDIQDAGTRFYTYETTVGYFLEAAGTTGTESLCSTGQLRLRDRLCRVRFQMWAATAS